MLHYAFRGGKMESGENSFVIEPERKTPVAKVVDVVVVGGGIAGVGASITSARNGMNTLLIEQQGCLGGLVTLGLVSIPLSYVEGVGKELFDRLEKEGALKRRWVDPEKTKYVLEHMVLESGAKILYYTYVVGAIVEDNKIKGVIVENKSGRQAILGKVVIDASGDADVCAYAGVPFEKGSPEHKGYNESTSLDFRVGNVDWQKYKKSSHSWLWQEELKKAVENKDLPYLIDKYLNWWIEVPGRPEDRAEIIICLAHSRNCDNTSAEDLTRQAIEGREQVQYLVRFLRKYIPGFENCWLIDTGPLLGVRESRRIIGEYVLTGEDVVYARKFEDGVVRETHGLDIHHPTEVGHIKHIKVKKPDGTTEEVRLKPGGYYEIPYRCFVPKKIDNLLVAGRCISSTFYGQSGARLIMTCLNMGQAVGTAAALSIKSKVLPRNLDVKILRQKLIEQGIKLNEEPPLYIKGSPAGTSKSQLEKARLKVGIDDSLHVAPPTDGAVGTDAE